jgi:hypothetical protein
MALGLAPAGAAGAARAAGQAPPGQTAQALFEGLLVNDPGTAPAIRDLLRSHAGFVAPRPAFADVTGDGRMDAVVQVRMPGAAGTVAVYAFSTHGTSTARLRAILRSQALYRATVRVAPGTVTVVVPRYAGGDDLCCPSARTERTYAWDARSHRMRRRAAV